MQRTFFRTLSALAVSASLIGAASAAGAYPDKPITFVVPSAAGGSPDVLSRLITTQLAKDTGATMVVENRPGAAGNIGIALVKRAAADGYTVGYGNINTLAVNRSLFKRLPYDVDQDLTPVAHMFVADDIGHGARLHPLEAVQAAGVATQQDAVDQAVGLVLAQRLGEHLADVAVGTDAQAGLVADDLDELAHDLLDLLAMDVAHLRHRHAYALDLLGSHVPQHLRGIGLTQRQQQDGCLVDAGEFGSHGSIVTHRR